MAFGTLWGRGRHSTKIWRLPCRVGVFLPNSHLFQRSRVSFVWMGPNALWIWGQRKEDVHSGDIFFLYSKSCRADLGVTVNVFMRNTLVQAATQTKCKPLLRRNKTSKQPKKHIKSPLTLLHSFWQCPDVKSGFYLTETSQLGDKKPRKLFLMCGKCSALATENHPAEYIGAAVWNIKETPKLSSG